MMDTSTLIKEAKKTRDEYIEYLSSKKVEDFLKDRQLLEILERVDALIEYGEKLDA